MKNASEVRTQLSEVFAGVRAGNVDRRDAETMANITGKMISSAKVQLEYYGLRGETPDIDFLKEIAKPDKAS